MINFGVIWVQIFNLKNISGLILQRTLIFLYDNDDDMFVYVYTHTKNKDHKTHL